MKVYTTYTPSHKGMYEDYFLKTIPSEFEVVAFENPEQKCATGKYYSEGWNEACRKKCEIFIDACKASFGGHFFYCDVDVQFFGNVMDTLLEELGDYHIACQDDLNSFCSGVFICQANIETLTMFKAMLKNYVKEDQTTLNYHINLVKHKYLSRRFWTIGHELGVPWVGQDFDVPEDILVHHSNWTVGIGNKIKLMDIVREKYNARKNA